MSEEPVLWLHAVTPGPDAGRLAGITGVGGGPVRPVAADGLVAVVAPVAPTEYGEVALRRNLEDLTWLERVAREHHRVADVLARLGPVVPARLATVYRDEGGLREALAQRRDDFRAAFDRVAGRVEWGVKAYAVPGAGAAASAPAASGGAGGAGTAYLLRRRAQLAATEAAGRAAARAAQATHEALARHARAARRHAPQDRGLSGVPEQMLLNGAYLVDADGGTDFANLVEALAGRYPAIRLELTGPWPPYSFADIDDGGRHDG
ncbi:GvpL/GvpF family gas vesicle protein [Micromonospora sp. NPDC049559]|uniref:GvpL/GvpF family gas vesicle protein n=1 Tax=Micromonospora sp. NPDC049559 TaxID=3155923 RepID=UPI00344A9CC9